MTAPADSPQPRTSSKRLRFVRLNAIALLLLLVTAAAHAATPAETLQICRFAAPDGDTPLQRWFHSGDVSCSAGPGHDLPSGSWNVFAISGNAISDVVRIDGAVALQPSSLPPLHPAATLIAELPAAHRAVVYAPRRATAVPLAGGRGLVPADENLWLFVVHRDKPVALFPVAPRAAGSETRVDARSAPRPAVVGWLSAPQSHRTAIERTRGLSPPRISAVTDGQRREADPLPDVARLHGSLFRLQDVPDGHTEITLDGRGWMPERRRTPVASPLTIVSEPLHVRATGTLIVRWSMPENVAGLARDVGSCEKQDPPRLELVISSCAPPEPGQAPSAASCAVVRQEPLEMEDAFGSVTLADIPPGFYRAEARYGKLPAPVAMAGVAPLQQRDLSVRIEYEKAYGSVTYAGDPLGRDAELHFPGGYGFWSAGRGEYRALLLRPFGADAEIRVASCDGGPSATVLSDEPLRRSSRFDIHIPANRLDILVTDTFTREPLAGATVQVDVTSLRRPPRLVFTRKQKTASEGTAEGRATFAFLPERELLISATFPGYQKSGVERLTLGKTDERSIEIQLAPLRGSRGRIISPAHFENAAVHWYTPAGRETERAELSADGTFVYSSRHSADEMMIVVSSSHPLWIARSPSVERYEPITVRFPDAPARTVELPVPAGATRASPQVAVEVGGLRVPDGLLRHHHSLRAIPPGISAAGTVRIADIAETGRIEVFLGLRP